MTKNKIKIPKVDKDKLATFEYGYHKLPNTIIIIFAISLFLLCLLILFN
jgi:hypothetical protein